MIRLDGIIAFSSSIIGVILFFETFSWVCGNDFHQQGQKFSPFFLFFGHG